MIDPLADSPWSLDETVQGFARSEANTTLVGFAARERARQGRTRALDIGCGAARNAVALARLGWSVTGVDLSWPMVVAARERGRAEGLGHRVQVALAPMDRLPIASRSIDLIVAHGIWNLAASADEFRRGLAEAARVATPGAGLFVFTFSRHTLPPDLKPVAGEPYAYDEFSSRPQTYLTPDQLIEELGVVGFAADDAIPFEEHNKPPEGTVHLMRTPVLLEAAFRFVGT